MSKQAPAPQKAKPNNSRAGTGTSSAMVVQVRDIDELYNAVNDPNNVGATIELQPGTYLLSPTVDPNDPNSSARPNGGRLDLQQDMSLLGVIGDEKAVTIETGLLPWQSLRLDPSDQSSFRLGTIRVGWGNNAIEWLTLKGNSQAAASIVTDHPDSSPTTIRVAHVVWTDPDPSKPATTAVDMRNLGASMAKRRIDAVIEYCDFSGGRMGIRFANFDGADESEVYGVMRKNWFHGNGVGCFLANNRTTSSIVNVSSSDDQFVTNKTGCLILGGIVITQTANSPVSNGNYISFEAYKSQFNNNNQAGISAIGGEAPDNPRTTSYNFVRVRLENCPVGNSPAPDFTAFGARNVSANGTPGTDIAGTYNTVAIELVGSNQSLPIQKTISVPNEPTKPTNKITVNALKRKGDVQPPDSNA